MRDEIEQLMDDDSDMAEMYLTEKKERMLDGFSFTDQKSIAFSNLNNVGAGGSMSAPVSPVGSPVLENQHSLCERRLEQTYSLSRSRHESQASTQTEVEELEMLLEAYFVVIDGTLNKLTSVRFKKEIPSFLSMSSFNTRIAKVLALKCSCTLRSMMGVYGCGHAMELQELHLYSILKV